MASNRYGRTVPHKKTFFEKIKTLDLKALKEIKWKDLTPAQRRKVILGGLCCFLLLLLLGLFSKNDEEAFKDTIVAFVNASSEYDVNATSKQTTSAAHQLVVSQANKLNSTRSRNYKTKVENVDTKIVSTKGKTMIATSRVDTIEQIGSEQPRNFTHLFIMQGQKVGASWKISNLLEAEAKNVSQQKDNKKGS